MSKMFRICFLLITLLLFLLSCGKDNPYKLGDNSSPGDTSGTDTTGQIISGLIPLAPGSTWKYSVIYNRKERENSLTRNILGYFGTYSLSVAAFDSVQNSCVLQGRFILDSLTVWVGTFYPHDILISDTSYTLLPGANVYPFNQDTTLTWNIVIARDTLWYDQGQSLRFFTPYKIVRHENSKVSADINLELLRFPWWKQSPILSYYLIVTLGGDIPKDFDRMVPNPGGVGQIEMGKITPDIGLTEFTALYSPAFMTVTDELLTYKLLEHPTRTP
jgi:hypothetical protein